MKNRFYILVCIFFTSLFLYSCQSAKDVIQGKTRSESSDEFLVQKKNPLSMPPDFNKLPVPVSEKQNPSNESKENSNLKAKLKIKSENKSSNQNSNSSLEKKIIEKISE